MRFSVLASWRGALAALLSLTIPLHAAPTAVDVQAVPATHGMVVAGHPEAAAIGVDVLRNGGNAADAAIAVSLALGVAEVLLRSQLPGDLAALTDGAVFVLIALLFVFRPQGLISVGHAERV